MGWVALGLLVVLLAGLLLARPWLIRRGWLYPPGERGSVSTALLEVESLFQPEVEHTLEERRRAGQEAEQSGEPETED